jgi:hypothetical protein
VAPVVVISGASNMLDLNRFNHRLLRKPLNIEELIRVAETHCGSAPSWAGC